MKKHRRKMTIRILIPVVLTLLLLTLVFCIPAKKTEDERGESSSRHAESESLTPNVTEPSEGSRETEFPDTSAPVIESSSETETESESESETESETAHPDMANARRIWVGDSRIVGLSESGAGNPDEDIFIGKNGRYYVWFYNDALPVLRSHLDTGEPFEVLVQIGINDCANTQMRLLPYFAEDYAELINSLIDEYPNARFWFLSVGEVIGTYGGGSRWEVKMDDLNPLVGPFNETMKEECRAIYLPVGELIKEEHKSYLDNVHYTAETNQWIYEYVLERIQEENEDAPTEEESLSGRPDKLQ